MKLQFITLIFSVTLAQQTFCMLGGGATTAKDTNVFNWENEIKCNQMFKSCTSISLSTVLTGALAVGVPAVSYALKQTFAKLAQVSSNCVDALAADAHLYHGNGIREAHVNANLACVDSRNVSYRSQSIANGVFYASTAASISGLLYWLYNRYTIVRRDQLVGMEKRRTDREDSTSGEKSEAAAAESAPLLRDGNASTVSVV